MIYDSCNYPQYLPEPIGEARYGMVWLNGNRPVWRHDGSLAPAQVRIGVAPDGEPDVFAWIADGPRSQTSPAFSYEDMDAGRVWAWVQERWGIRGPIVTKSCGRPGGDITLIDGEPLRPGLILGVQPHHHHLLK